MALGACCTNAVQQALKLKSQSKVRYGGCLSKLSAKSYVHNSDVISVRSLAIRRCFGPVNHAKSSIDTRADSALRCRVPFSLPRVPDGRGDVSLTQCGIVGVVDGHDLPVGPLCAARVTDVSTASVLSKDDFRLPSPTAVVAKSSSDAKRCFSISIG